jgi:hypothetical protein
MISSSWGGARDATPYAFTEQGVAMLSSMLKSLRAVAFNIEIMRAFVRLREMLASHAELGRKEASREARVECREPYPGGAARTWVAGWVEGWRKVGPGLGRVQFWPCGWAIEKPGLWKELRRVGWSGLASVEKGRGPTNGGEGGRNVFGGKGLGGVFWWVFNGKKGNGLRRQ